MGTLFTALGAATALAGTDIIPVHQGGARALGATGTQLLALVGTAYVPLAGGTMTGALTLPAGSAAAPSLMLTGAGSNTGVYSTGSNNVSIGVNGTRILNIGSASLSVSGSDGLILTNTNAALCLGSDFQLQLCRDAAGIMAQRFGTNQQIFRLYNTYTDSSNYERLTLTGVAGTSVNIKAETLGTGADNLDIVLTPAGTGSVVIPVGALATPSIKFSTGNAGFFYDGTFTVVRGQNSAGLDYVLGNNVFRVSKDELFGWCSSASPQSTNIDAGLYRNAANVIEVNTGTKGAFADLKLRNLLAGGGNGSYVQTPSMTVDRLADAATAGAGARAFVTDANATTFLSTVAAGGSNKVPVVSNGTNWLIG